ncbi:iron-sulfur cluster assembly protein [Nonomuraea sp. LPB2021202275-12-8]|uniref:iron-sulfur cluster assembly protein n=1 Tax=Nonomuraea sp. LPB2021202275-12-8 TaxID=3120159 RepID=UPI003FA559E0
MPDIPQWARQALEGVYDPCCREKGISVVEMGLVRSVELDGGRARVELLLTSGLHAAAAHRPLPRRPVALAGVRRTRGPRPRPDRLLGLGEPTRRP